MKTSLRILVAMAMQLAALVGPIGSAGATSEATFYLSVGDSLAYGEQPVGTNNRGYADQLFREVREQIPELRLTKLGCPGDTTESMISGDGSICRYPSGSQLDHAVAFLEAHRGHISFITIDIGINDAVYACFDGDTGSGTRLVSSASSRPSSRISATSSRP